MEIEKEFNNKMLKLIMNIQLQLYIVNVCVQYNRKYKD